jgi:hypothetical protein
MALDIRKVFLRRRIEELPLGKEGDSSRLRSP